MTTLGKVGIDGRMDRAVVEWPDPAPGLIDLATLTAVVDFSHDQDPAKFGNCAATPRFRWSWS
jgi:hypothetical protein